MREWITSSVEETEAAGREFAAQLRPGDVVALRGGLGAGKTAFVRGIASLLAPEARVSSPTFALMHEYAGEMPLYHFDLYRIPDAEELWSIGFEEFLGREGVVLIEWSENAEGELPQNRITVTIENPNNDDTRRITAEGGRSAC
ncbi:MAG: tRNA (adenosine(37)-N6)-threonylcarbamoyltransferase complex ATPase subunit type 1 TsaE [Clostridia bacterium]|nr:tRNA (adenosine(37)-N6)-threonylcarbamoyltransferase complex ATPase subunit type 1 TsaE [Clostridia bacterium]